MSYEGYTQRLCANGHLWAEGCYDDVLECPSCGEQSVWSHTVDCTNGVVEDENGIPCPETVPYPLEVERYEEVITQVPIYKIPQAKP